MYKEIKNWPKSSDYISSMPFKIKLLVYIGCLKYKNQSYSSNFRLHLKWNKLNPLTYIILILYFTFYLIISVLESLLELIQSYFSSVKTGVIIQLENEKTI